MNDRPRDDLTAIKGIGPAYQQLLQESLGVYTYRELGAFSADELESRLKAEGRIVSRSDIEAWIKEAQELAEDVEAGAADEANSPGGETEWKPFASFVVEFQVRESVEDEDEERRTTVHHMEGDTDASWPDIESVELCRWMLGQIGEPVQQLPEVAREQARQELEEELAETRAEALQRLEQDLGEEHARLREELEQERKEVRARAQKGLERELAEQRTEAQQALEQELEKKRSQAQQALEQELKEARDQAERALEVKLEEERAQARQEIEAELEEQRTQAQQALRQELEQTRTEAQRALEDELEDAREQAHAALERGLEQRRAEAQETLERELEERRVQAQRKLEQELEEMHAEAQQELEQELEETHAGIPRELELAPEPEPEEPAEAEPVEAPATVDRPAAPKITRIQAFQPPQTEEQPIAIGEGGISLSPLGSDEPFAINVSFEVDEADAAALASERATYSAQFHARDMSTGRAMHLGSTRSAPFVKSKPSYTAGLSGVALPAGLYRLAVLVTIETVPPSADYREVSMLHVA